jgi:AcrR family transcriptional regulator
MLSRRDRILAAGLKSFLDHGVAGASIDDVRTRSGASVGSIYHHFGGKQGLAGAVFVMTLSSYQMSFLAALRAHPDDARCGVCAVVQAHLDWCLREQPDYARFLLFHGDAARAVAGADLARHNREFFAAVLDWWQPHAQRGLLRALDVDLIYALWLGPAQEYCRLRLGGREVVTAATARSALAQGAWRSLRA